MLTNFQFEVFVGNFNRTFSTYFKELFELYERAFPIVKTAVKTKKPAPWMTDRLILCIRKKAKLYKLYLRGKIEKNRLYMVQKQAIKHFT